MCGVRRRLRDRDAAPPSSVSGNWYPNKNSYQTEATLHDQAALGVSTDPVNYPDDDGWPGWAKLTFQDKPRTDWYTGYDETDNRGNRCKGSLTQNTDCDEFPFQRTQQGGPPEAGARVPHLKLINASHNRSQHHDKECSYRCSLRSPGPSNVSKSRFLVVPRVHWCRRSSRSATRTPMTPRAVHPHLETLVLDRLGSRWREDGVVWLGTLRPGAEVDVRVALNEIGLSPPQQLVDWWGWHNGADAAAYIGGGAQLAPLEWAMRVYRGVA